VLGVDGREDERDVAVTGGADLVKAEMTEFGE
jgi:hypothetical protein